MRIDMTSSEAEELMDRTYSGGSPPLSVNANRRNANSLDWWLSSPRDERPTHPRKQAAVRCYLAYARRAHAAPPPGSFPAVFDFSDGVSLRPDKGLIKALYRTHLTRAEEENGALIFTLTAQGREQFSVEGR